MTVSIYTACPNKNLTIFARKIWVINEGFETNLDYYTMTRD